MSNLNKNMFGKYCIIKDKSSTFNNYVCKIVGICGGYYEVAVDGNFNLIRHFKSENLKIL